MAIHNMYFWYSVVVVMLVLSLSLYLLNAFMSIQGISLLTAISPISYDGILIAILAIISITLVSYLIMRKVSNFNAKFKIKKELGIPIMVTGGMLEFITALIAAPKGYQEVSAFLGAIFLLFSAFASLRRRSKALAIVGIVIIFSLFVLPSFLFPPFLPDSVLGAIGEVLFASGVLVHVKDL